LVPGERRRHVVETIPVTAPLRLMAVHAHPDDESSKGAAASARYVAEGVAVMVVTCTGGERGDVLNAAAQAEVDERGLLAVRRDEMARAAAVLGVRHAWLGFEDSGYPEGDPPPPLPSGCFADLPIEETIETLVGLIRQFRPQVVTTYDENGGYPHPDHIRTHETTMAALDAAADGSRYADLGPAWQVAKVYYNQTFSKARVQALHLAMVDADLDSPYHDWLKNWEDRPDDAARITTRVPCSEWFEVRDRALLQHRTQIDPDSMWFQVPLEFQREVWPTEDFQLARSTVPVALPEDDLFAGLREDAP
jgi:mycothiol S-conjugate amidase